MPRPVPIDMRIELAEAFIELAWATLPAHRAGIIEEARWRTTNQKALAEIDRMLDQLGVMYLERAGTNGVPDHYAAS
jgi:hypothetical protein